MTNSKACTKCGQIKPFEAFAKDKYKKSGITASCLLCRNEHAKNRRLSDPEIQATSKQQSKEYYHAHKEQSALRNRAWVNNNRDKRRALDAKFRANNRLAQAQRAKDYRSRNPDSRRNWSIKNPERQAAIYAKRSFAKRGGVCYKITLVELTKLYLDPCAYCGAPSEHIDHIVPLSRGGKHSIGNLTGACKSCNLSKAAKFITEWKKRKNEAR